MTWTNGSASKWMEMSDISDIEHALYGVGLSHIQGATTSQYRSAASLTMFTSMCYFFSCLVEFHAFVFPSIPTKLSFREVVMCNRVAFLLLVFQLFLSPKLVKLIHAQSFPTRFLLKQNTGLDNVAQVLTWPFETEAWSEKLMSSGPSRDREQTYHERSKTIQHNEEWRIIPLVQKTVQRPEILGNVCTRTHVYTIIFTPYEKKCVNRCTCYLWKKQHVNTLTILIGACSIDCVYI